GDRQRHTSDMSSRLEGAFQHSTGLPEATKRQTTCKGGARSPGSPRGDCQVAERQWSTPAAAGPPHAAAVTGPSCRCSRGRAAVALDTPAPPSATSRRRLGPAQQPAGGRPRATLASEVTLYTLRL